MATIEAAAIAALFVSPSTTASCGGRERAEPEAVDQADLGGRRERGERLAQAAQVRAVQAVAVDGAGRDHADGDPGRAARHRAEELLALRGVDLLRVVQERERADGVVAQPLVVEEDARRDERPGQAAPPGLVRARDEADAEAAVEGEELAARTADGRHGREDSA